MYTPGRCDAGASIVLHVLGTCSVHGLHFGIGSAPPMARTYFCSATGTPAFTPACFFFQTISPNCLLPEMRNHKAVQAGRDLNKGSRCVPSEVTITPTQTSTPCLTELRPAGPIIGQSAFGTSISKHFWVIPRQQQHTKIVLLE